MVFVPSLINPPYILDLTPDRSLTRWLATQGVQAWLLDWGEPTGAERDLDIASHVERLLIPLIARLDEPPILIGYCLGGTMSIAAAAAGYCAGLATIAAPWDFAGYGERVRADVAMMWEAAHPGCNALGLVPMEVLQAGFWKLDPARTVAKYETFGHLADADAAMFVAMEDWANAGAPLTYAAGADLFDRFMTANRPGRGAWQVAGRAVDPRALACPCIEFVSLSDRIVPAATAIGFDDRCDLRAGHVGMVVGSGAREQVWEPLRAWIASLPR